MKTISELANMTDTAFEAYMKRKSIGGMATVNLSAKRRAELRTQTEQNAKAVREADENYRREHFTPHNQAI
jgi:hypothetical protein